MSDETFPVGIHGLPGVHELTIEMPMSESYTLGQEITVRVIEIRHETVESLVRSPKETTR